MISRRDFFKISAAGLAALYVSTRGGGIRRVLAQIPGGTMSYTPVPWYSDPWWLLGWVLLSLVVAAILVAAYYGLVQLIRRSKSGQPPVSS